MNAGLIARESPEGRGRIGAVFRFDNFPTSSSYLRPGSGRAGAKDRGDPGRKVFGKGFDRKMPIRYILTLFAKREE